MIPAKSLTYTSIADSFRKECTSIADWWVEHAFDRARGGIWGRVTDDNRVDPQARKGIVQHARTLWFFSEWGRFTQQQRYLQTAQQCYTYLADRFYDRECGGVVWMLEPDGRWADDKKQIYAQAFAVYALAAYFNGFGENEALNMALTLFDAIEEHGKDTLHGGYREALSRHWSELSDARLSEKEDNSPKTMNTHLHVMEAYTQLHDVLVLAGSPRAPQVARALAELLDVYCRRIYTSKTGHLKMFMDDQWHDRSKAYSYGHDIESSWLIHKAIKTLQDSAAPRTEHLTIVQQLAQTCLREGIDDSGAMRDEFEVQSALYAPSAWWVQAEAMVGFTNMWQLSGDEQFLSAALGIWQVIQEQYRDTQNGEWFWFARKDHHRASMGYKIGPWKAPYHSGRAMMQMMGHLAERPNPL